MKTILKKSVSLLAMVSASLLMVACQSEQGSEKEGDQQAATRARIMAHGDLLYHDALYWSAQQADGSYDFTNNFVYVKPWIEQADLAIADFEGTISPTHELAGYPLFNAPAQVADALAETGYDVVDLAHNHILDSDLEGLISTAQTFANVGIDTVGVYPEGNHTSSHIYIKEVKGIKIAILAYTYGFNEMEKNLTPKEQAEYLSALNEDVIRAEIERAEKEADLTIIMPQMGVEYQLAPTDEQVTLYHKMVNWGADIIFGGHPHVPEPTETVDKDGDKKLIVYSMGNFISNQRIETMGDVETAEWTERGVLMDVTVEKKDGKTTIKTAVARPSWVSRVATGAYTDQGHALYDYKTFIAEDFLAGTTYRDWIDADSQARIDETYSEMNDLMDLNWK